MKIEWSAQSTLEKGRRIARIFAVVNSDKTYGSRNISLEGSNHILEITDRINEINYAIERGN